MAIVTIVEGASGRPSTRDLEEMAEHLLPQLFEMWLKHHERFVAGKRFAVLVYPRGAYAASTSGPTRDSTVFIKAPVAVAFSLSDEQAAMESTFCLRILEPGPDFMPSGVSSGDEPDVTVIYRDGEE